MNTRLMAALPLVLGACLAGCASTASIDGARKLSIYEAAAGEPVGSFSYLGRISGWTPLGDEHIAVWTRPKEAWLLSFSGICQDIEFTPMIGLTSQGSRVHAGFDKVLVDSPNSMRLPCRIREIRPLDVTRIREAEKAAREEAQDASSGT